MATHHKKHHNDETTAKKSDAKKAVSKQSGSKKSDPKQQDPKQAAAQSKHEIKAEQALDAAKAAVEIARHAVKGSTKKLQKHADRLLEETKLLTARHGDAVAAVTSATQAAATVSRDSTPTSAGTQPSDEPDANASGVPSMIELRAHAKRLGLTGVSRLSKAQLQTHLDQVEAERAGAYTATD